MIELVFLLTVACEADYTGKEDCFAETAPVWFETKEQCEAYRETVHKSILERQGLVEIQGGCLTTKLPLKGEEA